MNILQETTLNRVLHHFQTKDYPAGIISAERYERPARENARLSELLERAIRHHGYGFIKVDGAWRDHDGTETKEQSYLIIGNRSHLKTEKAELDVTMTTEDGLMFGFLKRMADRFDQQAFVFKPSEGSVYIIDSKGRVLVGPLKNIMLKELEVGYTKLRGRSNRVFAFEDASYDATWAGRLARLLSG